MEIKRSKAANREEEYKLTRSETVKMSDHVDENITVKAFCIYEDVNVDGEEQLICTILSEDGIIYGTNSKTFINKFDEMIDFFAEDGGVGVIKVLGGVTKAGRDYISCDYVAGEDALSNDK